MEREENHTQTGGQRTTSRVRKKTEDRIGDFNEEDKSRRSTCNSFDSVMETREHHGVYYEQC